jgi:hypothetical protein
MTTKSVTEPTQLTAGFGVSWIKTLTKFPSASHTLKYSFRTIDGKGSPVMFSALPDGGNSYSVSLSPADTAHLPAGEYLLTGYIIDDATTGATTKEVVYSGLATVKPDPLAQSIGDQRTHARRTRDLLRKAMEGLASGKMSSVSIQGKSFTQRQLSEVRSELARYEELVRVEEMNERLSKGCHNPNRVLVRFGRTQ